MINLQRTKALAKKEFIEIIRDRRSFVIMFVMPIIMMLLFGYAVTFDIRNLDIGIVDNDNSVLSRQYINKITSSNYFIPFKEGYNDMYKNIKALRVERIKFILVIPYDFSSNLKKGKDTKIQAIVDGSISATATSGIGYLQSITADFANSIRIDIARDKGIPYKNFPFVTAETRVWYNQDLKSTNFIVPGIIATIMMFIAAFLTSLTIVREKEYGTYEEIMSTPVTPNELVIGKLAPYIMIGILDVLLVTAFGILWFKVPFRGNVIALLFFSFFFIMCSLEIGMLISSITRKQEAAIMVTMFSTYLPCILLSGFMFPIESMPKFIQVLTYLVPARYFLTALRAIFLKQDVNILMFYKEAGFLVIITLLFFILITRAVRTRKL